MKHARQDTTISHTVSKIAGLALLSFLFLFVFAYYTSPISTAYGTDTAFFQLVGSAMTNGYVPYRDIFDLKGIYLFFFEYIGQLIVPGRTGSFILQWIAHTVSLVFVGNIVALAQPKRAFLWRLVGYFTYLFLMSFTVEGSSLAEEFSLPFLMASMYLNLRFFVCHEQNHVLSYGWAAGIFQGISVGINAFLRISNNAITLVFLACVIGCMLKSRAYRQMGKAFASFLVGLVLATLPVFAYGWATQTLDTMTEAMFSFGFTYAASNTSLFEIEGRLARALILVVTPLIATMFVHPKKGWMWLLSLAGIFATLVAILLGHGYIHYAALEAPLLAYAAFLLCSQPNRNDSRWRTVVALGLCFCLCCIQAPLVKSTVKRSVTEINRFLFVSHDNPKQAAVSEIARHIPEDERSSVYCYGFYQTSHWYLMSDMYPCIRFADFQAQHIRIAPEFATEIQMRFDADPPIWLVTGPEMPEAPLGFLTKTIETDYRLIAQNERYCLYRYRN